MNTVSSVSRRYDLDWLRVLAIIAVLYFHTAMLFVSEWDWHIKNNEVSNLWLEFNYWLSKFRMPLLFFISGVGSFFALRKRSGWQYLKERNHRLIVPLIFAIFVIVPPQIYFERLFDGEAYASYLDFYPTVFKFEAYPKGNTSWHHMWFVLYLFIYSAIGLPFFLWLRTEKVNHTLQLLTEKMPSGLIYLIALPTVVLFVLWTSRFEGTNDLIHDYGWLPYWFSFFMAGYIVAASPKLWEFIEVHRKWSLQLAVASIVFINYFRWNQLEPWEVYGAQWKSHSVSYLLLAVMGVNGWLWLLAILGYGKRYLNRPSKLLNYANEGIYPFYILHQTVIVALGYYAVQTQETILAKYLFVSTLSLLATVVLYDFLVKPFALTRYLFGMKGSLPTKKEAFKEIKTMNATP